MLNFIFMNLIALSGAVLIAKYFLNFYSRLDYFISLFIIFISWIIGSLLMLGMVGKLTLLNVITFNLLMLFILYLLIKLFKPRHISNKFEQSALSMNMIFAEKTLIFCLSLILGFVVVKIAVNLVNPPFGWDSINYHYTFPVEWLKNGNLNNPIVVSDDPFPSYYPINSSLLFLWLIYPFKNAFMADLGQLPFFVISFLSILSISKKLKISQEYSFIAACLFVLVPNFFKQLEVGYNDMMVGAFFLLALNFLLAIREKFNLNNVLLFALSFGLLIGIKTTTLAYATFLFLPFLYFVISRSQFSYKTKFKYLFISLFLILFFGCFSYIKNYFSTGNPLYSLQVSIFGRELFKGVITKSTFTARNAADGYSLSKLLFHEGLGIQTLLFILPGTILAPFYSIFRKKNREIFLNYILFLPLMLYLVYRFILPIPNTRYLYPALAMGMIVAIYILNFFKVPAKTIKSLVVIMSIASAVEIAGRLELIASLCISFLLFGFFLLYSKYERLRNLISKKVFISLVMLATLMILIWSSLNYNANEYKRYIKDSPYWRDATIAWSWLNNITVRNNIAYVGRPVPYPLYGTNLKNNVYYVSVNSLDPIRLHDLKNSNYAWNTSENMHKNFRKLNNYRGNADYTTWLSNLKRRKIDFLFIYSLHHTKQIEFPIEETWVKSHPEKFKQVFFNETIRIYKLEL